MSAVGAISRWLLRLLSRRAGISLGPEMEWEVVY
jgi:hypothetical protein